MGCRMLFVLAVAFCIVPGIAHGHYFHDQDPNVLVSPANRFVSRLGSATHLTELRPGQRAMLYLGTNWISSPDYVTTWTVVFPPATVPDFSEYQNSAGRTVEVDGNQMTVTTLGSGGISAEYIPFRVKDAGEIAEGTFEIAVETSISMTNPHGEVFEKAVTTTADLIVPISVKKEALTAGAGSSGSLRASRAREPSSTTSG